jgi:hypothetical protein
MQFDRLVGAHSRDDFFARFGPEMPKGEPTRRQRMERTAADRAEPGLDRGQGAGPFDQHRGNRAAARRGQSNHDE